MSKRAMNGNSPTSRLYEPQIGPFMGTIRAEIANKEHAYMRHIAIGCSDIVMADEGMSFEGLIRDRVAAANEGAANVPITEVAPAGVPISEVVADEAMSVMPSMLQRSAYEMGKSRGSPVALRGALILLERIGIKYPDKLRPIDLEETTTYLCIVRAAAALDAKHDSENHSGNRVNDGVGNQPTRLEPIYSEVIRPLVRVKARQRMLPVMDGELSDYDLLLKTAS